MHFQSTSVYLALFVFTTIITGAPIATPEEDGEGFESGRAVKRDKGLRVNHSSRQSDRS